MDKTRVPPLRTVACAFLLVTIGATELARAEYHTDFRAGIRAYDRGNNWPEVVAAMRRAISDPRGSRDSREQVNISGNRYLPYTPHFYLGVALANLHQCDEARAELAVGEGTELVPGFELVKTRKVRDSCAPPPVLTASTSERPPVTTSVPVRVPPPALPPVSVSTETPVPRGVMSPVPQVQPPADQLGPARKSLQLRIDDARTLLATKQTAGSRARDARARLSNSLATASAAVASTSGEGIASAASSLTASLSAYRGALGTAPPPALADAIRAYASGDYSRAIKILDSTTTSDGLYRGQIALFRAAARYSQVSLKGPLDDGSKRKIGADFSAFRSLDPKRPIDSRLFSPKFLAFVGESVRNRT